MPEIFDDIAIAYDQEFSLRLTGKHQRQQVHSYLAENLKPSASILEMNAGSGEDLLWLLQNDHTVSATDISRNMVLVARNKLNQHELHASIDVAGFHELRDLYQNKKTFDYVFSNFGGLNCIPDLELSLLANDLSTLLTKEGELVLVIMGKFSWIETGYFLLKGKWKDCFRRLSGGPVQAKVGDNRQATWYYSPQQIKRLFSPYFTVQHTRGIGLSVPPSYLDRLYRNNKLWNRLAPIIDTALTRLSLTAYLSDHYLIHLKKK